MFLCKPRATINGGCLFFKVEDLIGVGEKESFSVKQKVTFHVVMAVLVSCCSSLKETHFLFATRVFSLLQKKIKKLESVITTVVSKECRGSGESNVETTLSITVELKIGG